MTPPENEQISGKSRVVVTGHHLSADVGDEILILNLETGGYYSLEKVAAQIWKLLERPILVCEIADELARRYGVPQDRSEADVVELLAELDRRGLIRIVQDDGETTNVVER